MNTEDLKWYDWLIFALIAILCFFATEHRDFAETISHSCGFLFGHITDFYTYNHNGLGYLGIEGCNYMPSTYILLAIWCIPLRLFNLLEEFPADFVSNGIGFYCKIFTTGLFLATGFFLYKICLQLKLSAERSRLAMYLFLTAPLGFFSQFIFGQYDIFTVFFMVLGLYFYTKEDTKKNRLLFLLIFGFSCTFKYFALLFFLPLLLLRTKKISRLIIDFLIFCVPFGLEILLFAHDYYFTHVVLSYETAGHLTNARLSLGMIEIALVPFLFVLLCAACYLYKEKGNDEDAKYWIFFCNAVAFLCFGLSYFHPQWLLMMIPFMTLGVISNKHRNLLLLIDLIMMMVFCVYVVNVFPANVDQNMLRRGIFHAGRDIKESLSMRQLYVFNDTTLLYTVFSALLFVSTFLKLPRFQADTLNSNLSENGPAFIRARFIAGIAFFMVPLAVCGIYYFTHY